ncbi:MAG: pseudouridine synthase [Steroidobacteraceae bacterium]|jgi:23S rRNA pseudouridine2605 synthase
MSQPSEALGRVESAQRLQKVLATLGLGSRRGIEQWIVDGRITLNGRRAELGARVLATDDVRLDGQRIDLRPALVLKGANPIGSAATHGSDIPAHAATAIQTEVLGYHKPVGEVTTRHDPQGRPTVFDHLPAPRAGRWIVIGRLDVNTSGLLLFTNDGELAHRLMHPSSQIEREYLVRVREEPSSAALMRLRHGVELDDGPAHFETVMRVGTSSEDSHSWFRVSLREGRNREVRRLWQAVGHEVSRLKRLRYGPVSLPEDLRPAEARRLPLSLISALQTAVSGSPKFVRP